MLVGFWFTALKDQLEKQFASERTVYNRSK
jgi:hypothetical protein